MLSNLTLPSKRILRGVAAGALAFLLLWIGVRAFGPAAVEVVKPQRGPAVQAVYATGTVEATVMLPIAPRNTGRLVELNVDEGSNVAKGQQLARLEDEDLQKSLEELRAREEFAAGDYARAAKLVERGYSTRATRDRAKSEWDAAKAAVERAIAEANYMKLVAPADGRILRRDGEIGQLISANQPMFWLSCCAPLRVTAEVDEEDITLVQPGQEVLIRADAFPGKIFHGKVQSITPKGDPVARSYRVRIGFTEEVPLLIGMTAETNIIVHRSEDALLLPASVLSEQAVWLVKDGRLVKQPVTLGAQETDRVEIQSGVGDNDLVVRDPKVALEPGRKVRVRLAEQGK